MSFIKVKVSGFNPVQRKFRHIEQVHKNFVMQSMHDSLDHIARRANLNLLRKITNGRTSRGYEGHGHPLHEKHLADDRDDMSSWEIKVTNENNGVVGVLTNTCEHAAPVEFGVKGTIKPKGKYLVLGYREGKRSYENAILRTEVKGQAGYGFTQQVLDNQKFMNDLRNRMRIHVIKGMVNIK